MSFKLFLILLVYLLHPVVVYAIRLSATAPVTEVKEGGIMSVHCQLWDFESSYRVILSRRTSAGSDDLSWNDKIIVTDDSDIENRVYLAVRQLNDGSHVYFLSLTDVSRRDEGDYSCKIINSSTYSLVSEETVRIDVRYFPSKLSPVCSAIGTQSGLVANEGDEVWLNCTSEQSKPPLTLQWSRSGAEDVLPGGAPISNGNVISQMLKLTLTMRDNNRLFVCKISNPYFAGISHSCHVGPFRVIPNNGRVSQEVDTWVVSPSSTTGSELSNTVDTVDCLQTCNKSNTTMAYYWIMSTIIAAFLAVALCIAAIVLLFKYHRVSSGRKRLDVALQRGASLDDVYEKVDCRRDEGRMVYMSLKKCMKPGNPVMYVHSDTNTHYNLPPSNEQQTRTYTSGFTTKP